MEIALAYGSLMVYLATFLNTRAKEDEKPDYFFVVALGNPTTGSISCLGSVIKLNTILTLASCLKELTEDYSEYYNVEEHIIQDGDNEVESEERQLKLMPKSRKKLWVKTYRNNYRRMHRPKRDDVNGDDGDDKDSGAAHDEDGKEQTDNQEENVKLDEGSTEHVPGEVDNYDDYEDEDEAETIKATLFRIDALNKFFVRLPTNVMDYAHPAEYEDFSPVKLWRHNAAFGFLSPAIKVDGKIHPIPLATLTFGDYITSLHEEIINTEGCHIIGLIEYSDYGPYSPLDTDVELVAHEVLVDYTFECNHSICFEDEDSCMGTGHHIMKNPENPVPFFLRGAPLICRGKVLSTVNTASQCDPSKYSAEFASSGTIRSLVSMFQHSLFAEENKLEENKRFLSMMTRPHIPLPTWTKIRSSASLLNSWHVASPLIWLGNRILSRTC